MRFEELDAKLTRAIEHTALGYYDEAEKLVHELLAELTQLEAQSSDSTSTVESGRSASPALDKAALLRSEASLELANIFYRRGQSDTALSMCNEVSAQADAWNVLPLQRRTWNLIGQIQTNRGLHDIAKSYFERVISTGQDANDDPMTARAIGNLGSVYSGILDYSQALECYRKALAAFTIHGDRRMAGGTKVNMSTVFLTLNKYQEALECLNSALAIFEELGERPFRLVAMTRIGIIYTKLEKYDLALEHYLKIYAAYEELGSKAGLAITSTNIGVIHFLVKDYPLALEYHTKALAINEETGNLAALANSILNVGQVNHRLQRYDTALEYLYKALELCTELNSTVTLAGCLAHIGSVYADIHYEGRDPAKAEEFLLKSIAVQTETGLNIRLAEKHKSLAELYEQLGRDTEALIHYKKYHALEKEVLNNEAMEATERYQREREVAEREKEVALAKARADAEISVTTSLLHKVLPASIAHRLIQGEKIADYFQAVSILFADIVGFTPIAAKMPARKVLAFLNYVFGEFDRIIEKHGCEKIKTIGDGYMAVAGAPITCEDHAERIARAALELMSDIELPAEIRSSLPKGAQFSIRIGINMGPAFGGIVGENRFVYDIYSDAVNIAARMESQGEAHRIHVSEDFAFHLQNRMDISGDDIGGIEFEEREEMDIKGKGKMKTYFLERRTP